MEKQILPLNKNLKEAVGKTKAEFMMWLIWLLPWRPKLPRSTSFQRSQCVLLARAFTYGRLGMSAKNKKEGSLLGNGGPGVQGEKALCSRQIDIGSVRQNWHLGFPCLPFYASFLLPTPGHCRCSINTCGIKPDGLYILFF